MFDSDTTDTSILFIVTRQWSMQRKQTKQLHSNGPTSDGHAEKTTTNNKHDSEKTKYKCDSHEQISLRNKVETTYVQQRRSFVKEEGGLRFGTQNTRLDIYFGQKIALESKPLYTRHVPQKKTERKRTTFVQ